MSKEFDDARAFIAKMQDQPGEVLIEHLAMQAIASFVDEIEDDADLGDRVRHAIAVHREIQAQPPALVFPDIGRFLN